MNIDTKWLPDTHTHPETRKKKNNKFEITKIVIKPSSTSIIITQLHFKFQNQATDRRQQEARTCLIQIPFQ